MRAFIAGLLVAVFMPLTAWGQPDRNQEMTPMRTRSNLYYEAFALPGGTSGTLLTVSFRIPNDRLVFMRHAEGLDDKMFRASVSVTVELYQVDRLVEEKIWQSESLAEDYDATVDRLRSTVGSVTFKLDGGEYGYRVRLNDLNTERTASTPVRPVSVSAFDSVHVGTAILSDTVVNTSGARNFSFVNLGGDARFGQHAVAVIPLSTGATAPPESTRLKWALRKLDHEALRRDARKRQRQMELYRRKEEAEQDTPRIERPLPLEGGTAIDSGHVDLASFLQIGAVTDVDIHDNMVTLADPDDSRYYFLAVIDLNGRSLDNGSYVLDVQLDTATEPVRSSTRFSTHWPDMPSVLLDVDLAIKNLRFIVDKALVDRLKDGSREDKINKFKTFWSERDPTPETAYNELMVEYYQRVDHAALEYRTGQGMIPNGLETDRARIYVVHGPPEEVSRSFPEGGGVLETWVYADGRTFTFESGSSIDPFHIVKEG